MPGHMGLLPCVESSFALTLLYHSGNCILAFSMKDWRRGDLSTVE